MLILPLPQRHQDTKKISQKSNFKMQIAKLRYGLCHILYPFFAGSILQIEPIITAWFRLQA
jgi:hypothetical protein